MLKDNTETVLMDFSEPMLEAARARLGEGATILKRDFSDSGWADDFQTFDAVVSRFAIHHQTDERK